MNPLQLKYFFYLVDKIEHLLSLELYNRTLC
jgi:hypothetical protein